MQVYISLPSYTVGLIKWVGERHVCSYIYAGDQGNGLHYIFFR
ncbi:hypothetical protein DAI22_12g122750 [Oryza sativa Japonica Group]|nr:hypothetical protein DAI22_12g122750 [Oryza sativa Japonica Group]